MPSSVVSHIEYMPESRELRIYYNSGAVYDYLNVPSRVYQSMKRAVSKGRFLNKEIKTRYQFRKISGSDTE